MTVRRAALHNLGCKVNSYETEAMQQMLEDAGYEIVPFHEKADVYIINTCSVTNMADAKSRQMIHRARKQNPDAIVVATGCYVQTSAKEVENDLAVDIVLGNNRKSRLVEMIRTYEKEKHQVDFVDEDDSQENYEQLWVSRTAEHTRAFIKVQDGCNQFCSYCIIPYARGRIRSRGTDDVVTEVRRLAEAGYREVVLTGIHLSSYGMVSYNREVGGEEMEKESRLIDLIEAVAGVPGIERIRLGSLEPRLVDEAFVKRLAAVPQICPHFHLSLQSGCDATLKRMNRKYTTEDFRRGVALLRKYFRHPAITTDVIVGFPQESREEFEASKAFLKEIRFYEMHIFKYSRRKGTVADVMPGQIPEQVKHARSQELIALADEMSHEFREAEIGQQQTGLMETRESIDGASYWTGFTKEYVRVAVPDTGADLNNRLVSGTVTRALDAATYLLQS